MAMATAQQVSQNWVNGISQSTEKIRQGIQNVTESPTEKAIKAIPRMVQGIQQAAANGKIAAGLQRVSLDDWKRAAIDKGVPRVAAGAAASQSKFADFMSQFLPHLQSGMDRINREMPRGNTEQNINRAIAMMRHNAQFRRTR